MGASGCALFDWDPTTIVFECLILPVLFEWGSTSVYQRLDCSLLVVEHVFVCACAAL